MNTAQAKTPTFIIELKDGRELEIQAKTEAEAQAIGQQFVLREKAQQRLKAEDAQRGLVTNFTKNVSDSLTDIASKIPVIGGLVDEGKAGLQTLLQGGSYDENLAYEREREQQFQDRAPNAVKGMNYAPGLYAGMRALPTGVKPGASLPAKIVGGGVVGTALGVEEGFTRGEGGVENRVNSATGAGGFGGVIGATIPIVGQIMGSLVNQFTKTTGRMPTTDDLLKLADQGYDIARAAGVSFTPQAWRSIVREFNKKIIKYGIGGTFDESVKAQNPISYGVTRQANEAAQQARAVPLTEAEQAKSITQQAYPEPISGPVSKTLKERIDTAQPGEFVPGKGNVNQALEGIQQGRYHSRQHRKAEQFDEAMRAADIRGKLNYAQAGKEHAVRKELGKLALDKDFPKNFTEAEQKAILAVVNGTRGVNSLRFLGAAASGKLLPFVLGATLPLPVSAPIFALSAAAKMSAKALTLRNARIAEQLIKSGKIPGPSPQSRDVRRLVEQLLSEAGQAGEEADVRAGRPRALPSFGH